MCLLCQNPAFLVTHFHVRSGEVGHGVARLLPTLLVLARRVFLA